jgi:DNA-binding NarL/FixJ family response regulator
MKHNEPTTHPKDTRVRAKILLVDDSEVVRDSVALMLEARGFDVVPVTGVFGLPQVVAREAPDLILMDVSMPAISGDKAVEIVRRNEPANCPMVLFSDRKPEELERLAYQCGAAGFIRKTGNGDELAKAVETYLLRGRGGRVPT